MPRTFRQMLQLFAIGSIFLSLFSRLLGVGTDRLLNISARSQVGTGSNVLIAGFYIGPGVPKRVLVRAVGPTLSKYAVTGVLANPLLTLYDSAGNAIATNDDWSASDNSSLISAVGASPLAAGTRDSVLSATLPSGAYTAIVTGVNNSTGVALAEVYEIDGAARLINLSARAQVGSGSSVLIAGMVVNANSGSRRILIRGVGPALANYGVPGCLADPKLTVFDSALKVIATNDNWGDSDAAGVAAATTAAGAQPLSVGSKDSALVLDLPSGSYTAQISNQGTTPGVALIETYDITPGTYDTPPALAVNATVPTANIASTSPAVFTLSRSGDLTNSMDVSYTMSGTAVAATDYEPLAGTASFATGSNTTTVLVSPIPTAQGGTKSIILTLGAVAGYDLSPGNAQVTLYTDSGKLYLANLRTTSAAVASTAYGTSTLTLTSDESAMTINLAFSNLSSGETEVHLRLNDGSPDGVYLTKLPIGQSVSTRWTITPTSGYSVAQIVAALKAGNLFISVNTVNYPSGELAGAFVLATGSQTFSVPLDPPSLPTALPTATDAARFLMQATFGPTQTDIDALTQESFSTWITNQIAVTPSSHRAETVADFNAYTASATTTMATALNRQEAWWKIAVTGKDQLRQRVAFALSELFVISDQNGNVYNWQEGAANYEDLLATDAFGNFRTLLEDVTLNPMMGMYLSSIKNSKATSTTEPDENYGREVMQLFTIGLNQLQPDGSLKLDGSGLPIPTYDQATVSQMAEVFTGWQFHNPAPTKSNFRSGGSVINDYIQPMTLNPSFHEDAAKTIVGGVQLPAGEGGINDLKLTLDALFNHPNMGPFVCRQLIERLVTSNPSPGYIYRVAKVFADNGSGVRGDLTAVIRAILLDYEARSPDVAAGPTFGKLKEPLLRVTALLRAFSGAATNGRYNIPNPENSLFQASLRSTTVFNFFDPNYVVPGTLASQGLYAPEFQILTATSAISIPNNLYSYIYNTASATVIGLNFTQLPTPKPADALVDELNLLLSAKTLSPTIRTRVITAINALPASTTDLARDQAAVYLITSTQASAVQK